MLYLLHLYGTKKQPYTKLFLRIFILFTPILPVPAGSPIFVSYFAGLSCKFSSCPAYRYYDCFHQIYRCHYQPPDKHNPSDHTAHKHIDEQNPHCPANVIPLWDDPEKHPADVKWNAHKKPQLQIITFPILYAQRTEQCRQEQCRYNRDYNTLYKFTYFHTFLQSCTWFQYTTPDTPKQFHTGNLL